MVTSFRFGNRFSSQRISRRPNLGCVVCERNTAPGRRKPPRQEHGNEGGARRRHRRRWRTRNELISESIFWIEHTYNRRRRQRVLGKLTPVEFELAFTPPPCLDDTEAA